MSRDHYLRRFERNELGRDFVVGDIHGSFARLSAMLASVDFDTSRDRLFSVGDMVDRGEDSFASILWMGYPWFHAVRGNHEQMAIGVAAGRHDLENYAANGGQWFLDLDPVTQQSIAREFDELPVCIEIETRFGRVGLVHADIEGYDWDEFVAGLILPASNRRLYDIMEHALWSRERIRSGDTQPIAGLHRMYVGHTPVHYPALIGNIHYIDTGAVFGRPMTMVCISTGEIIRDRP